MAARSTCLNLVPRYFKVLRYLPAAVDLLDPVHVPVAVRTGRSPRTKIYLQVIPEGTCSLSTIIMQYDYNVRVLNLVQL